MIKNVMAFLASMFFFVSIHGEKTCTDIWTMDNNINGISLYKVSLHMCTEGIMTPTFIKESDPLVLIDNLTQTLNMTNFTNTSELIIPNITSTLKNKTNVNITYISPSSSYTPSSIISSITPSSYSPSPTHIPSSPQPEPTDIKTNLLNEPITHNTTHDQNMTKNKTNFAKTNKHLEPVHIVLLSVGCTILGFTIILVIYIVVKKYHCKNKINNEEKKSTLYKKKPEPQINKNNENSKNNIKLTVNTHKEKLKALERFNKMKKKPERKNLKQAAQSIINLQRATKPYPKKPPGMDIEKIKQKIPQPNIGKPNTPPSPKVNGGDIV